LKSGIPLQKSALGVNRLCGSGFQAIISGAQVNKKILQILFN
jgi:acetyl-CoA acyltransferase 2